MGVLGDTLNEFKQAKPAEKAVIIGAIVGIVAIAAYIYWKHNNPNAQTANNSGSGSTDTSGAQLGFPTVPAGQTPVLPAGVSPVYDASGNVVAYSPGGVVAPPSTASTTPTDTSTAAPATTTTVQPAASPAPFFGKGTQVIAKTVGGKTTWYYKAPGGQDVPVAPLFPKGTTFSGGSTGQAFYTLPGGQKQPLSQIGAYGHQKTPPPAVHHTTHVATVAARSSTRRRT